MVEYHKKWKLLAMQGYANGGAPCCNCCGVEGLEFLSIDHVNNDGHIERKLRRGDASGLMLYRRIVREAWPDTFQVLCFNCNMAKAYFGVCPHKRVQ